MKKLLVCLLVVMMVGVLFVGCDQTATEEDTSAADSAGDAAAADDTADSAPAEDTADTTPSGRYGRYGR